MNTWNKTLSDRQPEEMPCNEATAPFNERRKQPLRSAAFTAINNYFADLDGHEPGNLYDMMVGEVEQALFNSIMQHTRGNQSKAAAILGINRSTLRKKLRLYGLLD